MLDTISEENLSNWEQKIIAELFLSNDYNSDLAFERKFQGKIKKIMKILKILPKDWANLLCKKVLEQ